MSKVEAQRAMRENRYAARRSAGGPTRREEGQLGETPAAATASAPNPPAARVETAPAASEAGRCGHRSMNGRACTRAAAHPEKNHRYA